MTCKLCQRKVGGLCIKCPSVLSSRCNKQCTDAFYTLMELIFFIICFSGCVNLIHFSQDENGKLFHKVSILEIKGFVMGFAKITTTPLASLIVFTIMVLSALAPRLECPGNDSHPPDVSPSLS